MCSYCLTSPCHPRCPNAPEPVPKYVCSECGEGIFEGDKFFENGKKTICEYCLEDMTVEEILELFDEELNIA